jgi:hypothetical protein
MRSLDRCITAFAAYDFVPNILTLLTYAALVLLPIPKQISGNGNGNGITRRDGTRKQKTA